MAMLDKQQLFCPRATIIALSIRVAASLILSFSIFSGQREERKIYVSAYTLDAFLDASF